MGIESITKGSTVLLRKEANEVPLPEQLSSQSSSLTLPLEREANLERQTHHSQIFALKHLPFSH